MKTMHLRTLRYFVLIILLGLPIAACTHIQLIAPYDERIEKGITELQKNTTEFFVEIERKDGSDTEDYKNYIEFYDDTKVATRSLLIRAGAVAYNETTEAQIKKLMDKYKKLEKQHTEVGLSAHTVPLLEASFDQCFRAILILEVAKEELADN